MTYPYAHSCGPDLYRAINKYWKYKNADPSTAKYASIVTSEILKIIEEKIASDVKRFYHIRPDSILGIDLRHAVIRELVYLLSKELLRIDKFEKENSGDIRNFDSQEEEKE